MMELLTTKQAGSLVGAGRTTVDQWVRRGLPSVKVRHGRRVEREVFLEWFKANRPNFGKRLESFHPRLKACNPAKGGAIYALCDPRPEYADQPIRYIGQAKDFAARRKFYRCDFNKGRAHSRALQNWFRKLKRMGLVFEMRQLDSRLFGIGDLEREWIVKGRALGWRLLNVTDGGDQTQQSKEVRERLAAKASRAWQRPEYRERWERSMEKVWAAKGHTPEVRAEKAKRREANRRQHEANMRISAQRKADAAERAAWVFVPLTHKGAAFVPLNGGHWAVIDQADWEQVSRYRWYANPNGNKVRARRCTTDKMPLRQFLGISWPRGKECNPLDCRKRGMAHG